METFVDLVYVLSGLGIFLSFGYAILGLWGVPFDLQLFFRALATSVFLFVIFGIWSGNLEA